MPSIAPPRLPGRAVLPDAGWTLTELLISLAVMGILAALAIPSYQQQQRETRRSEARAALQQLQLEQASHRSAHVQYAASLSELGHATSTSASGLYQLAITAADTEGYTLEAKPLGAQARDSACAPLRLAWRDPALEVRSSGTSPDSDPARCWTR